MRVCFACLSVRLHGTTRFHWVDFHENLYLSIFPKSVEKFQASFKSGKNNEYFTWKMILQSSVLFRMINISDKYFTGDQNTHFTFNNILFFENRAVYEIMWKNTVYPDMPQMTIWRMRIVYWIPKATYTHSESVTLFAFPLQKLLHECSSVLCFIVLYCGRASAANAVGCVAAEGLLYKPWS